MQNLFLIIIVVALIVTVVVKVTNWLEASTNARADRSFQLTDYTYRDDKGNLYVVTSADISDNWSLLIEEYGLSAAYISKHVFLTDAKPVL